MICDKHMYGDVNLASVPAKLCLEADLSVAFMRGTIFGNVHFC